MHYEDLPACFQAHLGLYAIEPLWFTQAVQAVQRGLWPVLSQEQMAATMSRDQGSLYAQTDDGVAVIRIVGQITKGLSKFGGTSTVMTRRALRQAVADDSIKSILLAIDSPGGQVAGVQDLADEVLRTRQRKPVAAYIEDQGASAAYWIASQAQRITANRGAEIGSIGVFAVLQDLSGAAERDGVQVRVVSTGPYKGLGVPGTPVTQDLLDEVQSQVDQVGTFFFSAVQQGRKLSDTRLQAVTDGRVWIASQAQELGLIDGVHSFDEAITEAATLRPRRRMGAESPHAQLRAAWGRR
jgi:signal peptide peptidase SppA